MKSKDVIEVLAALGHAEQHVLNWREAFPKRFVLGNDWRGLQRDLNRATKILRAELDLPKPPEDSGSKYAGQKLRDKRIKRAVKRAEAESLRKNSNPGYVRIWSGGKLVHSVGKVPEPEPKE
jgi:hypothetical protein